MTRPAMNPPPIDTTDDTDGLDEWMTRTAAPTAPVESAAPLAFEGMTFNELRGAIIDLHGQLQVVRLERDAARADVTALEERLRREESAHAAYRRDVVEASGHAPEGGCSSTLAYVRYLRDRLAAVEARERAQRLVPMPCRDCEGRGLIGRDTECGACGGEGCRS